MNQNSERNHMELLNNYKNRLNKAQIGHYITSEKLSKYERLLGSLSVILSTFISGFLFYNSSISNDWKHYSIVSISLTASIASALLMYLKLGEKSHIHLTKASEYGILKRKVETFIAIPSSPSECKEFLREIEEQWNRIAYNSPLTSRKIRRTIENEFNTKDNNKQ